MPSIEEYLGELKLRDWRGARDALPCDGHEIAHVRRLDSGDESCVADLKSLIRLLELPRSTPPLFVSYYTSNTPYEALATRLRRSLDRLGVPHRIEAIESLGTWVANTGLKAAFIKRAWEESDRPICWVDADAELLRRPDFVFDNPFDIAVVRRLGWYDISSFVYLNKTETAGRIVATWAQLCRDNPHVWDQVLLTLAWFRVARNERVASMWLSDGIFRFPRPWIRDLRDRLLYYPRQKKIRPFVDQKQASRTLKSFVDGSRKPGGDERGSDDISEPFKLALKSYDFAFDASVETVFR
ncbi:hypothetical protein MRS76_03020 [Rhizobiaceae bacterium n13]|uniref:Uncharacterized protein n=1 Tax=Ferirhizobium litorale TaxID=2927786 RepID=A0AAE3QCX9_9HYPH|nr:hypothetical protein [Fererhizobium litorale]MDI7860918.1 hypothetical protein [Fererhizobium litorale]MDI7921066.1 hypothetical protein [Fererhizobium litorale]